MVGYKVLNLAMWSSNLPSVTTFNELSQCRSRTEENS